MLNPPIPKNEKERLARLYEYSLLDTMDEKEYDQITKMAALLCDAPISLISLIDRDRQWFKSSFGLDSKQTPRDQAFCAHAINEPDRPLVVSDSREDERFKDNPLVAGEPNIGFYAGFPLVTKDNLALGTLCVIDRKARDISEREIESLEILANQVVKLFELRRTSLEKDRYLKDLEARNKNLEEFARVAAHDIKSPLANIRSTAELVLAKADNLEEEQKELIGLMMDSSDQLSSLIDGILRHSRTNELILEERSWFSLPNLVDKNLKMLEPINSAELDMEVEPGLDQIYSNRTAWQQIIINLVANALKYNNNPAPKVTVHLKANERNIILEVKDNGPGIAFEDQERIFRIFQTTSNRDHTGSTGTGIGLATVKNIVNGIGGEISLQSTLGEGASFIVSIPVI